MPLYVFDTSGFSKPQEDNPADIHETMWAALKAFGPHRPDEFPFPKYQREKVRVSCQDLIRNLRSEVVNHPERLPFDFNISANSLFDSATL